MRICKCGSAFPFTKTIDGKRRNLRNRTVCLACLPFGQSKYKLKSPEEKRSANAEKARLYYHKRKALDGTDPIKMLRSARKDALVHMLGGVCQLCGYNKTVRNLVFHHLRDKKFALSSRGFQYNLNTIIEEIKKCAMMCHNCHGEVHDNLIDADKIKNANIAVNKMIKKDVLKNVWDFTNAIRQKNRSMRFILEVPKWS